MFLGKKFKKAIQKLEDEEILDVFGSYFLFDEPRLGNEEYQMVKEEVLKRMREGDD